MDVKRVGPSFGMAVRRNPGLPETAAYIEQQSGKTISRLRKIIRAELKNPVDIYIGAYRPAGKKLQFVAEVGDKKFKENFFFGPVSTLKKAAKYAQKLYAEQLITQKHWGKDTPKARI